MPSSQPKPREADRTLLFITMGTPSFIREDLDFMHETFRVRTFLYSPSRRILPNVRQQMRLFAWLILNAPRARTVIVWFADYHAFLPVLFSRLSGGKSIVMLAGYDVTRIPKLNYGVFSNPIRSACARFAIGRADILAPVARALAEKARLHVPIIRGRIVHVPFGFDASRWFCDTPKENLVLTVGFADDETRIRIKGLDFFVRAAERLPHVRFAVIGLGGEARHRLKAPPNVRFFGRLPRAELRKFYSRAKVYAQLSLSEGMPNVVCEAMLCECVPVGTDAGGIPETIGDAGFILAGRDPETAARTIRKALAAPASAGRKARQRVAEKFSEAGRREKMLSCILSGPFIPS
ncbi:glycosyltransferase family 4 protein [bacterium]|nr:glycosyltransferase family 4 protein [bacterium]